MQGPQRLKQTDRNLLLHHFQPGRHDEIQNFLGAAPFFNIVFVSKQQNLRLQTFDSHFAFTCSGNTKFFKAWSVRWLSSFKQIRRHTDTRSVGTFFDNI